MNRYSLLLVLFCLTYCSFAQKATRGGAIENNAPTTLANISDIKNIALVIGTDNYDASSVWRPLTNPVYDALTIGEVLKKDYGYDTIQLLNAKADEILAKFDQLRRAFTNKSYGENANLLIFIAGHGGWDDNISGFIVPKDAKSQNEDNYRRSCITHNNLRQIIENINAPHTLVLIDACFGGGFDERITNDRRERNVNIPAIKISELIERKKGIETTKYITSGGKEYVPDGTPGAHSPFAYKIIEKLIENYENRIPVTFSQLTSSVEFLYPEPKAGNFGKNGPTSDFILIPNSLKWTTTNIKNSTLPQNTSKPVLNGPNLLVKGKVLDRKDGTFAFNSTTYMKNIDGSIMSYKCKDGYFQYSIKMKDKYVISAYKPGYSSSRSTISTYAVESYDPDDTVQITIYLNEITKDFKMCNIYFDYEQSTLRSESLETLDTLISFLKENTYIDIDIFSYADGKEGKNEEYRMALTQRRSQAIIDYVEKNGVNKSQLGGKGFGSADKIAKENINDKDNPEGRQLNRRSEIRMYADHVSGHVIYNSRTITKSMKQQGLIYVDE